MSEDKLQIEICADSGCGLIVADVADQQFRVSMLPDEVIEAKNILAEKSNKEFIDYIEDINPKFERAVTQIGDETLVDLFLKKTNHIKK
jgi:hypothetical protein